MTRTEQNYSGGTWVNSDKVRYDWDSLEQWSVVSDQWSVKQQARCGEMLDAER